MQNDRLNKLDDIMKRTSIRDRNPRKPPDPVNCSPYDHYKHKSTSIVGYFFPNVATSRYRSNFISSIASNNPADVPL